MKKYYLYLVVLVCLLPIQIFGQIRYMQAPVLSPSNQFQFESYNVFPAKFGINTAPLANLDVKNQLFQNYGVTAFRVFNTSMEDEICGLKFGYLLDGINFALFQESEYVYPIINYLQDDLLVGEATNHIRINGSAGSLIANYPLNKLNFSFGTDNVIDYTPLTAEFTGIRVNNNSSALINCFTIGNQNIGSEIVTDYLSFNGTKKDASNWTFHAFGDHNGGAIIYNDVDGFLHFITVPSNGIPDSYGNKNYTDNEILERRRMTITPLGKVGIGKIDPLYELDVNEIHHDAMQNYVATIRIHGVEEGALMASSGSNENFISLNYLAEGDIGYLATNYPQTQKLIQFWNGKVIVAENFDDQVLGDYKFIVDGKVLCEELRVQMSGEWNYPDYVFDKNYKLPSLKEIEEYIIKNHHLEGVPSAAEVENQGISVGEMNTILLKKIEELTLHQIEMQKEIDKLKKNLGYEN